ncbi:putative bifunctional diguanylate cyclase/phosphodiesterase [Kineococcus sp. SYSU DK018]|uniref:putative bifunctional diguanylate cyclase/phosphodiesterase n=1 Tax=Kineococcus sp. SYSU DK018 TaxID=3383139 RepID=UPI003D7D8B8D
MRAAPRRGTGAVLAAAFTLATAASAVLALLPGGAAAAGAVQAALWVAVVAALVARAVRGPGGRRVWAAFAVGTGVLVLARLRLYTATGSAVVDPAALDRHGPLVLVTLAGYAAFYAGQVALLRDHFRRLRDPWLDGALGVVLLAAVCSALFLEPLQRATGTGAAASAAAVGRPSLDVLVAVLALTACALVGRRADRRLALVAAALSVLTLADVTDLVRLAGAASPAGATHRLSVAVDVARLAAGALLVAASRQPAPVVARRRSLRGWPVLMAPLAVLPGSVALLLVDQHRELPTAAVVLAFAAVGGVTLKVVLVFAELLRLLDSHREAVTDELTGLANRRGLLQRLARTTGQGAGLLLVDLDRFKDVNDTFGHHRGDDLLRAVAARLTARLPDGALLARLGGDEFALLLPGAGAGRARRTADALLTALTEPFELGGLTVHLGASIGVTASTGAAGGDALPGGDVELLRQADTAMYVAKRTGGGVAVYDEAVDRASRERLVLLEELRAGIAAGQLVAHYQPQLEVRTGRVVGVEALVRWQHPRRGLLLPAVFLDLAEERGLTGPLTEAVLRQAVAEAVRWHRAGRPLRIAVNLATGSLLDPGLAGFVQRVVAEAGLDPAALLLEITETTLMRDPERSRRTVAELLAVGAGVSIDDYGTGYSSLAYLRDLPAAELKLDRTFTARVAHDERSAAIVAGTADLAHSLGMRLLAEGVEDATTLHRLRELGVDETQGYHHARPMPAAELLAWLERHAPRPLPSVVLQG